MKDAKFCCAMSMVCILLFATDRSRAQQHPARALHWIASTSDAPWREMSLQQTVAPGDAAAIRIDDRKTFQSMDGFGSCFNELGWVALLRLDPPDREKVLQSLFSKDGANFTLGRVPMGANDFALSWYSYDETPDDYAMKHFSIDRDRQAILPFIHAAMRYQSNMEVWGVPWSPPSWMKTNGAYRGGAMKSDPQTLASYALYFEKYVAAYRAEGIHLFAVMPQNEPKYNNNIYPQAVWTGDLMDTFIREYLSPRFQKDKVDVPIWQGTIVNDNLSAFITPVLGDPVTNSLVSGIAYQYAGQKTMLETHDKYPNKKMMQSETECYNGDNSWDQGLATFSKIIDDTNHFAGSYFYWNTVLNDDSKSSWGWRQNSLITVDRKSGKATYNPEFYSMKHFSAFVLPGAKRIGLSDGPFKQAVAFRNPSGDEVIEFENESKEAVTATIDVDGVLRRLVVPAQSMNSLVIEPL